MLDAPAAECELDPVFLFFAREVRLTDEVSPLATRNR
jgi:hypothetical protein